MEDCSPLIADFFSQLRSCCQRLETSCAALRASVNHPSATLPPSNSTSLLTTLVDRISSTSQAVGNLESKTAEVVSFQELLGHSMEIYKQNELGIDAIEERLKEFGYIPAVLDVSTNGNSEEQVKFPNPSDVSLEPALHQQSIACTVEAMILPLNESKESLHMFAHARGRIGACTYGNGKEETQFDSLYSGTLSIQELGLSAAGLACLAEQDSSPSIDYAACSTSFRADCRPEENAQLANLSVEEDKLSEMDFPGDDVPFFMAVDEHEYANCPTWLKMQISFEDLNELTDRMHGFLVNKEIGNQTILSQEDIASLNAGTKMKPCLLLLVKLGRLRMGHEHGATVYRIIYD